jgi:hypothetical protein
MAAIPAATGDDMKALRMAAAAALVIAAASGPAEAIGNLADLTILDRSTGRELPVYWHEGRAYVVGRPGNEYQVTVKNRRGDDLLAVVSVDGVNVMDGQTASPSQAGYIVSPWRRVDIRGWRKSMSEIAAFYFTSLGDSYAARTDRPQNVGVIGVALFERKRSQPRFEEAVPPASSEAPWYGPADKKLQADRSAGADLNTQSRAAPAPSAPLGTGHGRREDAPIRWVEFERATDAPAETITIYYDSYRNLVARGILTQPIAPRDPNPWPQAFAPDPWR